MSDKQVLFAINTYLYDYLDCDIKKWGNLQGDIKSQIKKYTKLLSEILNSLYKD